MKLLRGARGAANRTPAGNVGKRERGVQIRAIEICVTCAFAERVQHVNCRVSSIIVRLLGNWVI